MSVNHYIFLIHGTWGKSSQGWYQIAGPSNNFANRLAKKLEGTDLAGAVWRDSTVFEWNAGNTHDDRLIAASDLATFLIRLRYQDPSAKFHFIAHSHGGNVVLTAIAIYITRLPTVGLELFDFPYAAFTIEDKEKFFEAGRSLIMSNHLLRDVNILMKDNSYHEDVKKWYEDFNNTYYIHRSGEKSQIRADSPNSMMVRLARLLLRLASFRGEHGILSTVFLGTPFYYKEWSSGWAQLRFRARQMLMEAALMGLAGYAGVMIVGALFSWMTPLSWIGVNPLSWPWFAQVAGGLAVAWGALTGYRQPIRMTDTNVYFDQARLARAFREPREGRLFDALVINSDYLDEAYMGLSSAPVAGAVLPQVVDKVLKPKLWGYSPVARKVGTAYSFGEGIWNSIRTQLRRLKALFMAALYPARWLLYTLITRPIALRQAASLALPLAYGLPADELSDSTLVVRKELEVPQIRARHIDVGRDLLVAADRDAVRAEQAGRFEFLWDEAILAERFDCSVARTYYPSEPSNQTKRHLLAMEERLKEFFGVAGLRHSLYYDNPKVLNAITDYLLRWREREAS